MFITFDKILKEKQFSSEKREQTLEDFLLGIETEEPITFEQEIGRKRITIEKSKDELKPYFDRHKRPEWLGLPIPPNFPLEELHEHYSSFKIPKKSGGLRDIDAPDDILKNYLRNLKDYFECNLKILTHDAAHAYVKERSTVTAVKTHQANNSNWFLKMDLKHFFPSHTLEYTIEALRNIYPLGFLMDDPIYETRLIKALEYAFLDNKLPQGTPLSPTLTNILMMPIDYKIQHMLWDNKSHFIYTRYADDILISSPYKFHWPSICEKITKILKECETPFEINQEKTRFGSKNGQNWNLGIMLNKDNRMSIGHKQNQRFRASIFNLIKDYQKGVIWPADDRKVLDGQISYYMAIDPEYTKFVLEKYEQKYNVNLKRILRS